MEGLMGGWVDRWDVVEVFVGARVWLWVCGGEANVNVGRVCVYLCMRECALIIYTCVSKQ